MNIPRIIRSNPTSDLVGMALAIMSVPFRLGNKTKNAVVIFPGMGEENRIKNGLELWVCLLGEDSAFPMLLIAGINRNEKTFEKLDLELLRNKYLLRLGPIKTNLHTEINSSNTKEQAEWLRDKVKELKITSLVLCASYYHILRAYLTVLKTFNKDGLRIHIIPYPTKAPPETISPEVAKPQWELMPGEVKRILKYQKLGDVATEKELREYLDWFWKTMP